MKKQSFPKQERIVSQKLIDELFTSGQSHSLTAFPLRAVFLPGAAQLQLLLSVPKRQLREAFRKNKQLLADALPDGQAVALAFIWMSDRHASSAVVEQCVASILKRIASTITVNQ